MKKIDCQELEPELALLSEDEAVRQHLESCPACRERLDDYQRLHGLLRQRVEVDDDQRDALHQAVMGSLRRPRVPLKAMAALVVAGCGLAVALWPRPDRIAEVVEAPEEPVMFDFEPQPEPPRPSMWSYRQALSRSLEDLEERLDQDADLYLKPDPTLLDQLNRRSI
ncbi:MAG: hypothetical protein AAF492_13250 [Verrucomicrobiota bacterium]